MNYERQTKLWNNKFDKNDYNGKLVETALLKRKLAKENQTRIGQKKTHVKVMILTVMDK